MRIHLSAGEHSGDMHAANLARALRDLEPDIELTGMGGPLMRAAGVDVRWDPTAESTIGFSEALVNYRHLRLILREVISSFAERRPDAVVWVDFGGFNLMLAGACRRLGIPVVCVFSPSAWAYGRKRAELMAGCVTRLAAVLPFEAEFYRSYGLEVTFVGHPLLDLVRADTDAASYRSALGLAGGEEIVALLPGSRRREIIMMLPLMLEAVTRLLAAGRRIRPVLPLAPSVPRGLVEGILARFDAEVAVTAGCAYDALSASIMALISSGTATLEAAILGVPMVSCYRVSALSYMIYRLLRNPADRSKPVMTALPNLVAARRVVPELLQNELTADRMAAEAARILDDAAYRERMRGDLAAVKQALGEPGASRRIAGIVRQVAAAGR